MYPRGKASSNSNNPVQLQLGGALYSNCYTPDDGCPSQDYDLESYPEKIEGYLYLSEDKNNNPFYGAYKILLPYCTGDAWLGEKGTQMFDAALDYIELNHPKLLLYNYLELDSGVWELHTIHDEHRLDSKTYTPY